MKIYIIRHGYPDYEHDCLTLKGKEQTHKLSQIYNSSDFDYVYTSTMGRAVETCEAVIKNEKEIQKVDFLREFFYPVLYKGKRVSNFDYDPLYFESSKILHDNDKYLDSKIMRSSDMKNKYNAVIKEFDKVLEEHGYKRYKGNYKVIKHNDESIAFFCHFGMMCVLLSRLFNIPYPVLTQHLCCLTSGVTALYSEEIDGIAYFRMVEFGNRNHLFDKATFVD